MSPRKPFFLAAVLLAAGSAAVYFARAAEPGAGSSEPPSRLAVVWSSGDPEVAHRVCLMYTHGAGKQAWFDEVRLIVWGPSARLLAADKDLQEKVRAMMDDGIEVQACIVCADSYGVTETLRSLDIEVKPMGRPLTDMLRSDYHVLTF